MSDHLKKAHNPFDDTVDDTDRRPPREDSGNTLFTDLPPAPTAPTGETTARSRRYPKYFLAQVLACLVGLVVFGYNTYRYFTLDAEARTAIEAYRTELKQINNTRRDEWMRLSAAEIDKSGQDFARVVNDAAENARYRAIGGLALGVGIAFPLLSGLLRFTAWLFQSIAVILHDWFSLGPITFLLVVQALFWAASLYWLFVDHRIAIDEVDGRFFPTRTVVVPAQPGVFNILLVCAFGAILAAATATTAIGGRRRSPKAERTHSPPRK